MLNVYRNIVAKTKIISKEELEQLVMKEVPVELMTTGVNRQVVCSVCLEFI